MEVTHPAMLNQVFDTDVEIASLPTKPITAPLRPVGFKRSNSMRHPLRSGIVCEQHAISSAVKNLAEPEQQDSVLLLPSVALSESK